MYICRKCSQVTYLTPCGKRMTNRESSQKHTIARCPHGVKGRIYAFTPEMREAMMAERGESEDLCWRFGRVTGGGDRKRPADPEPVMTMGGVREVDFSSTFLDKVVEDVCGGGDEDVGQEEAIVCEEMTGDEVGRDERSGAVGLALSRLDRVERKNDSVRDQIRHARQLLLRSCPDSGSDASDRPFSQDSAIGESLEEIRQSTKSLLRRVKKTRQCLIPSD